MTCLLGCFSTRLPPEDVGVMDCDLEAAASDDVGRGCLGAGCFVLRPRLRSPDDPAEGGVGGTKDGGRSLSPLIRPSEISFLRLEKSSSSPSLAALSLPPPSIRSEMSSP